MRGISYTESWKELLTPEIVSLLTQIHEFKGEQNLFIEAHEDELEHLLEIARIQSTEASNRIEGIYTSDERLKLIALDKTMPKTRSEFEIAGYRDVLNTIHNSYEHIPLKPSKVSVRYDTDFTDEILSVEWKESDLESDELKNYKAKAEYYVRQHQDNIVIAKLKTNKPLTSNDISVLENILWCEIGTKEDYEAEYGTKPLGEFVREIVGLDMNAAKTAFSEYLYEMNMDSRQIYFVNQIVEYIVHNGMMKDLSVLQESPFTDKGSVVEIFTDLNLWMGIRRVIEQINANAAA